MGKQLEFSDSRLGGLCNPRIFHDSASFWFPWGPQDGPGMSRNPTESNETVLKMIWARTSECGEENQQFRKKSMRISSIRDDITARILRFQLGDLWNSRIFLDPAPFWYPWGLEGMRILSKINGVLKNPIQNQWDLPESYPKSIGCLRIQCEIIGILNNTNQNQWNP